MTVTILSVVVLLVDQFLIPLPHVAMPAMGVFGIALSLFLGFRNNAAYDRWWEGRTLWGALIGDTRSFARDLTLFVPDQQTRHSVLSLIAGFVHLHRGQLRGVDATSEAARWLGADRARIFADCRNPADAALRAIAEQLAGVRGLSDMGRSTLSRTLAAITMAQAGAERIATTPLPFVYSLLVRRTTYLYCLLLPFSLIETAGWLAPIFSAIVAYVFFGLQTVTRELEQPFATTQNALPLEAMCRVVEISMQEAMGVPADPPLRPDGYVLN